MRLYFGLWSSVSHLGTGRPCPVGTPHLEGWAGRSGYVNGIAMARDMFGRAPFLEAISFKLRCCWCGACRVAVTDTRAVADRGHFGTEIASLTPTPRLA